MRFTVGLFASASSLALLATGAQAQTAETAGLPERSEAPAATPQPTSESGQDIIVTGSRIARRDLVAASPIVTASTESLQGSGQPTIDSSLLQLPQFQPGAGSFTNSSTGGTVGQSTLNLRGLGPQRNLVLLEGRRLQPSNIDSVIDINTIPSLAIGNVEVISGGASATYGSDAMSGVVNFKLRTDFRGVELRGQAGLSDEGDAGNQQIGFLAGTGFANDRGSLIVSAEYVNRDVLTSQQRDFTRFGATSGFISQGVFIPQAGNFPSQAALNAVFGGYGTPAGAVRPTANIGFNNDGTLFNRAVPTYNYRGSTTNPFVATPTAFGYNSTYFNFVQVPLERINLFAHADYDLGGDTSLYAQGYYNHAVASTQASQPISAAPWQLDIPVTNPFISSDLRTLLASRPNPTAPFTINKRNEEAGPRAFTSRGDVFQGLAGIKGTIPSLDGSWDVYASYGQGLNRDITTSGALSVSAARTLINAPDGGRSICAGGYNPFGVTSLSPECQTYLLRRPVSDTKVEQAAVEGTVQGALAELPAGQLRFALTGGYRWNGYDYDPDPALIGGDISSITATQPTNGSVNVVEGAAELLVPVLADLPFVQQLNVSLGYRYSRYNISGGVSAYKAEFDWRPVKPLLIRGGYQRSVRAPNIGELFLAPSQTVSQIGLPPTLGDPCDVRSSFRTGANGARVRALCVATGINPALADSFQQPTNSVVTQTQGNRDLSPETANTFTFGAVLQSPFDGGILRRMSLTVDYYDIKIKDAISAQGATISLQKCFNGDGSNPSYDPTNYFCTLFGRDPTSGLFTTAVQPYLNLGGYRTSGIDAQFDWRVPFDDLGMAQDGGLTLSVVGNYLDTFKIQTLPGDVFQDYTKAISSTASYPRLKVLTTLLVDVGDFQLGGRWRHIAAFDDITRVTNPAAPAPGTPAYEYFDLTARARVGKDFELRGGILNVGDKQPPIVGAVPGQTNLGTYDVIGRAFYLGFTARY